MRTVDSNAAEKVALLREKGRGEERDEVAAEEESLVEFAFKRQRQRPQSMPPRMVYTGIRVKNMDQSIAFYTEVLGMKLVEKREKTPLTEGEVVMLKSADSEQLLELNWYEEGSRFGTPYMNGSEVDHLGFDVENLDQWVSSLEKKGVKILVRIREIGGWNEAFIEDPNGIWIEFLQRERRQGAPANELA
jgi:lactoylglutathione lyase